jgi:hypothetical protein
MMPQTTLGGQDRLELDHTIRALSGRAHAHGLSTPFTHSALHVIEAGGKMPGNDVKYLLQAGLLETKNGITGLSNDGTALLAAHRARGDNLYVWGREMAHAAQKAPRLVAA